MRLKLHVHLGGMVSICLVSSTDLLRWGTADGNHHCLENGNDIVQCSISEQEAKSVRDAEAKPVCSSVT